MLPTRALRITPFILLALITIVLMTATVVDKCAGAQPALHFVYLSPWLITLWALTAVTSLTVIFRSRMTVPALLLHLSLLLILAGAAVTHFAGEQGYTELHDGEKETDIFSDGNRNFTMPFSLRLLEHGTRYQPGTQAPSDYYSIVEATGHNGKRETFVVSVSGFSDFEGYRFCQNAITPEGSTLSVNHDPWGTGITYAGYFILFVSMAALLVSPSGRFRRLLRSIGTASLLALFSLQANAADEAPRVLQAPLAKTFGKLYIYDGDRVRPLSSYARDFLMKIHGSTSYRGLTPEQVLTGYIFYYDDWASEPIIKLKSAKARQAVGSRDGMASLSAFGGSEGYRLEPLMRNADSKLREDNERVAVLTRIVTGDALRLLPSTDSLTGATYWLPISDTPSAEMEAIARDIAHGRYNAANEKLKEFRSLQQTLAEGNMPSEGRFKAELLYDRVFMPLAIGVLLILIGVGALLLHTARGHNRLHTIVTVIGWTIWLWLTTLVALRWYISGHIPLASGFETMLALAWVSLSVALICGRRLHILLPLGMVAAGASMIVAMLGSKNPAIGQLMPVLGSPLLSLHVMLVMTSYSLLLLTALNSLLTLLRSGDADEKKRGAALSLLLLYPAEMLLGAGIFVGAIWANESWGRYWGWDPKETWALITFFIYALPLHSVTFPLFRRPKALCLYLSLAFLSVIMTYFGVNYLLSGLHSYGA